MAPQQPLKLLEWSFQTASSPHLYHLPHSDPPALLTLPSPRSIRLTKFHPPGDWGRRYTIFTFVVFQTMGGLQGAGAVKTYDWGLDAVWTRRRCPPAWDLCHVMRACCLLAVPPPVDFGNCTLLPLKSKHCLN